MIAALAAFACGTTTAAEPASGQTAAVPPPLTEYKGRTIAPTMTYHGADWLIRQSREKEEHCRTLLKALKLQPGETVCDMGCGNGFYTLKMAKLVGKTGRVLAVDIQPEMLHLLELRAKEQGLNNIERIQS
ncbi:MAG TPA: methyltransferase domain-containing protein, partial [Pirellulales bacterium]|nr:methyltransferase domain-containing protein [Pirellulales bacterium]